MDDSKLVEPGGVSFPVAKPPPTGDVVEVRPGILWTQLPLPFALNHVNVYLLKDGDGWAVVDTGIRDERTRQVWRDLLAGPLRGERLTRLIVTHFHPDHIGAAGHLIAEHGLPLTMSRSEYLYNLVLHRNSAEVLSVYRDFYVRRGLGAAEADAILRAGHNYVDLTAPAPPTYRCISDGDTLKVGERAWEVFTGGGHSWEQVMLYDRADNVIIVADQVLPKISPNVSVVAVEPNNDPLGVFLTSINRLAQRVRPGALALPGHRLPFFGLHDRIRELADHHVARCDEIIEACAGSPKSPAELIPILFFAGMDTQQTSFAFCEIVAHISYLQARGALAERETDGRLTYHAASAPR